MTDSTFRESRSLPPGWVMTTVGRVGSIRLGRQRSPEKLTGRYATKYLRPANITAEGQLDLAVVLQMDFAPAERTTYALKRGDILLVDSSGSASQVGRAAIWNEEIPDCCYQNHLIRFRPHACTAEYASLVFRHYAASGEFARIARGVGIQHLGASRLAQVPFPLPPLNEQFRISSETSRRLGQLDEAEAALRAPSRGP